MPSKNRLHISCLAINNLIEIKVMNNKKIIKTQSLANQKKNFFSDKLNDGFLNFFWLGILPIALSTLAGCCCQDNCNSSCCANRPYPVMGTCQIKPVCNPRQRFYVIPIQEVYYSEKRHDTVTDEYCDQTSNESTKDESTQDYGQEGDCESKCE